MTALRKCALLGASGDLVGVVYPVAPEGGVVGRSIEALLQLDHDGVSRFHARLEHTRHGAIRVSDLGSSNGTFVNGRRVLEPQLLSEGDRVRFGPHVVLVVRYGPMAGRETVETPVRRAHSTAIDLLAMRNEARVLLGRQDHRGARDVLAEVVAALDESSSMVAPEDLAELLTEFARACVGVCDPGDRMSAVAACERALALLFGTSSESTASARAKFVLGQALMPTEPRRAYQTITEAVELLQPGSALRSDIEAWLAAPAPAPRVRGER